MEEDIKILEDFVNGKIKRDKLEKYKGCYKMGFLYKKSLQKAIQNLIARNKELKEKYSRKLIDFQKEREQYEREYIPKSKAKEKIEEINNEKLNYSEDEYYLENEIKGYAIDKIKELIED